MRNKAGRVLIPVLAAACALCEPAMSQVASEEPATGFMVGCWAQPGPEANGLKEFFPPSGQNMLTGLSQYWREGRIVDFEFHRIDHTPEGPVLTPHPRGVGSVRFHPAEIDTKRIVWENLEHDFPQRIIYHRVAADTLVARTEGDDGSGPRVLEWRMARIECTS